MKYAKIINSILFLIMIFHFIGWKLLKGTLSRKELNLELVVDTILYVGVIITAMIIVNTFVYAKTVQDTSKENKKEKIGKI